MMKLTFLGATATVTGSKYLLELGSKKYLIDCGLFQGPRELRDRNWEKFPVDPAHLDAVILTHAHIDHSGYLPVLVKRGFHGPIYCSRGTRDLCRILLPDSGRLQEEEAGYANKKKYSRHSPALPLYTQEDAEASLKQFRPIDFGVPFDLGDGGTLRLQQSGHIIGSSFIKISDGKKSIVFSGDLGRPNDPVLKAPEWIEEADYLLIESTYGDRLHEAFDPLTQMEEVIHRALDRRAVIVVPAFSVGRSQTLLYQLYLLKKAGRIPEFPVFLNSPMSIKATHIFCEHLGEHRLTPEDCEGMCSIAKYVNEVEESKDLNRRRGPMMIISASGMATGGRVLHHLKAFAPHPENIILLAGYQGIGTRGRALLEGKKTVRIHGEEIPVKAEVISMQTLSAHADQSEILGWLSHFKRAPQTTFITHGESGPAKRLQERIEKDLRWDSRVPSYLESVELS
jgi:metallo-beta-lactamase family protein